MTRMGTDEEEGGFVYRLAWGLDGTDGAYRTYGLGMWEMRRLAAGWV